MKEALTNPDLTRADALDLRRRIIDQVVSPPVLGAIAQFGSQRRNQARAVAQLDELTRTQLMTEMSSLTVWEDEHWILNGDESVSRVTEPDFYDTEEIQRFSHSESLRSAPRGALAIRALMSAFKSPEVGDAFSEAYGSPIGFRTADIARYRAGHYLRRHSDTYEDRVFGLVFFISDSWQHRDGGQLVVEYPDGRVDVLDPEPATVVALPIAPGYWHMVAEVRDTDWVRHSVAAHFGVEPR